METISGNWKILILLHNIPLLLIAVAVRLKKLTSELFSITVRL